MTRATRRQHGEGSLYQRASDGRWVAVADLGWKNGKRDRRYFYGWTPGEAREKRDKFSDRRRDGFVMPKGRPPYVSEWMLHWLHNIIRGKVTETTWQRSYRQKVEEYIVPYFSRIRLTSEDLTEEAVEDFHRHMLERRSARGGRLSPTTVQHTHRILSMALKQAVIRGRLIRNPCSNVTPPARAAVEVAPPEDHEVRAILRQCASWRTGARWVTAMVTGVRQGEALALMWPNVNLDEGLIQVQWSLARLPWQHGCGEKGRGNMPGDIPPCGLTARRCPQRHGGGLLLKRPKTPYSRAQVPLAPFAVTMLREHKRLQAAERLAHPAWDGWQHDCERKLRHRELVCPDCGRPSRPDLMVFTQRDGHPVDARADYRDWQALLAAAGLGHYRVHDTRHGFATAMLEAGLDMKIVADILRHSTPDFTRRFYAHVRPKTRQAAADAIEAAFLGL